MRTPRMESGLCLNNVDVPRVVLEYSDHALQDIGPGNLAKCTYPWRADTSEKEVYFQNKRFAERLFNYMNGYSDKLISIPSRVSKLKDMPHVIECDPVIRGDDCVYHENEMIHGKNAANPFAGISSSPIKKYAPPPHNTTPTDSTHRSKAESKWYSMFNSTSKGDIARSRSSSSARLSPRGSSEHATETEAWAQEIQGVDTPQNVTKRRPHHNEVMRQMSLDVLDLTAIEDNEASLYPLTESTGRRQLTISNEASESHLLGDCPAPKATREQRRQSKDDKDRGRSKSVLVREAEELTQAVMPRLVEDGMKNKLNAIYARK